MDTDGVKNSLLGSGYDEFFPAYTKHDKDNDQITFIVRKSVAT